MVSCSLFSCISTMNRHRRQRLCCRNQYRSRSGLGAPPRAPWEPAPECLSLSYRCCLLPAIVLLSSTLSRTVQQHGVAGDSPGAGELANLDSLASLGEGGNKQERPLGRIQVLSRLEVAPIGTLLQPAPSWPILPWSLGGTRVLWPAPAGRDAARRWFLPGRQRSGMLRQEAAPNLAQRWPWQCRRVG